MVSTRATLSSSKAPGPSTFSRFNELPPELRVRIWQEAMPEKRTVVVKSPFSRRPRPTRAWSDSAVLPTTNRTETWSSNTQIPALLHVNAESRHEASKHYQLSLGAAGHSPRVYIDFSRDTVFFGSAELRPECSDLWSSTNGMEQIRRLAIVPEGAWRVLRWRKVNLGDVERIIFVHDTDKIKLGPDAQLVEDEVPLDTIEDAAELVEGESSPTQTPQEQREDAVTKRMQAAREELETLMMVLPTQWEKEPAVSTGIFK